MSTAACWKKKDNVYLLLKIDNECRSHVGGGDGLWGPVI